MQPLRRPVEMQLFGDGHKLLQQAGLYHCNSVDGFALVGLGDDSRG
jgi:hypothetical protein